MNEFDRQMEAANKIMKEDQEVLRALAGHEGPPGFMTEEERLVTSLCLDDLYEAICNGLEHLEERMQAYRLDRFEVLEHLKIQAGYMKRNCQFFLDNPQDFC